MHTRSFVFCIALSTCLLAGIAHAGPVIQHWQTGKGMDVYFVEAKGLPLVDIQIVFDAGSARDGKKFGAAAMVSTLLDKGAGEWDANQIAERLEGVGAKLSLGVSRDSAAVILRSLTEARNLEIALQTTAKVLSDPKFKEEDFLREQKRILATLKHNEELPDEVSEKAFFKRIYADHPYAHPILGETESVTALKSGDMREFHRQYYAVRNAIGVVVGDVSKEKAASIVEQLTAELPAGARAEVIAPVDYQSDGKTEAIAFPSAQTHINAGMPSLARSDPDYYALYVGNHVLGGSGLVSMISKEIREKRGLVYSSSSAFVPMFQKGPFIMGLQTRNDQSEEALRVLNQIVDEFISKGPSEEELDKAKKNLTGGFVLRIDSNSKVADYVAMIGFYGLPLDYLDTFSDKVNAVSADQIAKAFQSHLNSKRFQTVLVGGAKKSGG